MNFMTVRELESALAAFKKDGLIDGNTLVALARDEEGNGYSLMPRKNSLMVGYMIKQIGEQDCFSELRLSHLDKTLLFWPS
ncbi:MAG: hypothetical protein WCQ41_04110 [Bacillota bacterium]